MIFMALQTYLVCRPSMHNMLIHTSYIISYIIIVTSVIARKQSDLYSRIIIVHRPSQNRHGNVVGKRVTPTTRMYN